MKHQDVAKNDTEQERKRKTELIACYKKNYDSCRLRMTFLILSYVSHARDMHHEQQFTWHSQFIERDPNNPYRLRKHGEEGLQVTFLDTFWWHRRSRGSWCQRKDWWRSECLQRKSVSLGGKNQRENSRIFSALLSLKHVCELTMFVDPKALHKFYPCHIECECCSKELLRSNT